MQYEPLLPVRTNIQTGGAQRVAPTATSRYFDRINMQSAGNPATGLSFFDRFLGTTMDDGTQVAGWGMPAINAAAGLFNAWTGYEGLKLADETLDFNKKQFNKNYEAQRSSYNTQLEDRQRARVAAGGNAYESVGSYLDKNRI